jgi:hypothetical protein
MSHALAVEHASDEMILKVGENDHAEYFAIGTKITVTWMAGYQLYCCLPCKSNSCEHTERVHRWRKDHVEAAA